MHRHTKSHARIIVLSLLEKNGRMYGYQISKLVEDKTNGQHKLAEGILYPLLEQLRREGLVLSRLEKSQDGPPRRYVELTEKGKKALEQEKKDLLAFLALLL